MQKLRELWQKLLPILRRVFQVSSPTTQADTNEPAQISNELDNFLHEITYETISTSIQGQAAELVVTLDLQELAPLSSHPNLLELVIRLNNPDEKGLTLIQEKVQIDDIRKKFLAIPDSIYVGSVTSGGMHNSYIYLPANAVISEDLKTLNIAQQYSFEVRPDPGWQYYSELLPTLEETERVINSRQIAELQGQGVDLTQPRLLTHTVTGEISRLTQLQPAINNLGYQTTIRKISEIQQGKSDMICTKESILEQESLTEETLELARVAAEYECIYTGWKATQSN